MKALVLVGGVACLVTFGPLAYAADQARPAPSARALAPDPNPAAPNSGGPSERDIELANDPHRAWWDAYHPGEAYQAATALAAHRLYCHDHPADSTCAGWDWH